MLQVSAPVNTLPEVPTLTVVPLRVIELIALAAVLPSLLVTEMLPSVVGFAGPVVTVYVNVMVAGPPVEIVNVPLYSDWVAPLIVTVAPFDNPWATGVVAVAVDPESVIDVTLCAAVPFAAVSVWPLAAVAGDAGRSVME